MRYTHKQLATKLIEMCEQKNVDVSHVTDAFVSLLAQHHDLGMIRSVAESIEQVWKERYGAATVTIETAHPLTSALRKKLELLSSGAELKEKIDESLIGGARVRIDDRIIDGSLSGHINQLHQTLLN